jgi:hypothetical protein
VVTPAIASLPRFRFELSGVLIFRSGDKKRLEKSNRANMHAQSLKLFTGTLGASPATSADTRDTLAKHFNLGRPDRAEGARCGRGARGPGEELERFSANQKRKRLSACSEFPLRILCLLKSHNYR